MCCPSFSSTASLRTTLGIVQKIHRVTSASINKGLTENTVHAFSWHKQTVTSWLLNDAENRFFLHNSAFAWGNEMFILVLHWLIYTWDQTSPVVYDTGGYLISPVNSSLWYLARIHCSLKTLWFKRKDEIFLGGQDTVQWRKCINSCGFKNMTEQGLMLMHPYFMYSQWLHFSLFLWYCHVSSQSMW